MADKVSVLIHWLLAWLLKSPTGEIKINVAGGRIMGVEWRPLNEQYGCLDKREDINLDDPFLSQYLPRPKIKFD